MLIPQYGDTQEADFLFCFQAISALNRKSPQKKNKNVDSDSSGKISALFLDQPSKVKEDSSPNSDKKTPPLLQIVYLPIHQRPQRVMPMFWSGRNYLEIAEFGIPI